MKMKMLKLGVLGSTRGTVLEPIIHAIKKDALPASIEIILSNKPDAYILQRAQIHKIPYQYIDSNQDSRIKYDKRISVLLNSYQVNLILLIGYMRILSHTFINEWRNKIINIHPSLLPDFSGLMNLQVHQAVIAAEKQMTGCTVHFVEEIVDAGPILLQKKCPVFPHDTAESLKKTVYNH